MKRILIPNLVGASIDLFITKHANGVFTKKDFMKEMKSRGQLNDSEIKRAYDELHRNSVFVGLNQRTSKIGPGRITNYSLFIENIKTVHKGNTKNHVKAADRDYINLVKETIKKADIARLDEIQDLINQRRDVIKQEERLRSTYKGLLEYADCDNAEDLIDLINKAKNL